MFPNAVWQYIERIRNRGKRRYAEEYLDHLAGNRTEPERSKFGISCMVAQAVRQQVRNILQLSS